MLGARTSTQRSRAQQVAWCNARDRLRQAGLRVWLSDFRWSTKPRRSVSNVASAVDVPPDGGMVPVFVLVEPDSGVVVEKAALGPIANGRRLGAHVAAGYRAGRT